MKIRKLKNNDFSQIMNIQKASYPPHLHESIEIFESIARSSEFCYVAEFNSQICGYLFSHLWTDITNPPKLHTKYDFNQEEKCCFIHDLAVDPEFRNMRIAQNLFQMLCKESKIINLPITLVAVNGADVFWHKMGFSYLGKDGISHDIFESYDKTASYMIKTI